jgi:HEAT repeat protein
MIDYLEARLAPGDRIFGFPAMGLVSYVLGRTSPVRSEYFFSGRPDHATEVRILATLAASPPRFIVTLNRRLGYFFEAPIYYFMLRPFVLERYALVARAGRYDVLELRASGATLPPPTLLDDPTMQPTTPDETFTWMGDPDREVRRAAVVHFLATAGDAAGVVDLAAKWAPDERRRLLLVRNLGEHADDRALPFLAAQLEHPTSNRMRDEVGAALIILMLRDTLAPYLFAGDGRSFAPEAWRQLDLAHLRAQMTNRDGRLRLGLIASHAFASADERAAIPLLEDMLSRRDELDHAPWIGTWLRVAIAESLVRLGRAERMCDLVDMLEIDKHEVQDIMPSRLIIEARRHPEEAVRCITRGLTAPDAFARANSAFIGGAASLPALAPGLHAAASDTDPDVRLAARWALARIRGETGADASVDVLAESGVAR